MGGGDEGDSVKKVEPVGGMRRNEWHEARPVTGDRCAGYGRVAGRKLRVSVAMLLVGVAATVVRAQDAGQQATPQMMAVDADPDWDVLTVSPHDPSDPSNQQSLNMQGRQVVIVNRAVEGMLLFAYGLQKVQLLGEPDWAKTERWDVQGLPSIAGHPSQKQMQSLVRKLLEERFGLKVHKDKKELSVYAITVAKGGEKMGRSAGDPNGSPSENETSNGGVITMRMTNMTMSEFAPDLAYFVGRPAVDQTGLTGRYDFQLKWTVDESKAPTDGSAPPGMFTAIQEQVGLKLEPVRAMAEVVVIDAVEKPGAN